MPRRPRSDYYLNWVEDPKLKVRGWKVRVPYLEKGRLRYCRKLVSESRYGGTKELLRGIAIRLRDELVAEFGISTFGVACFHRKRSSRNTSGHIGVYRIVQANNSKLQVIWAARWMDPEGKIVMRRFSVGRHGEKRARSMAIIARAEGIMHTAKVMLEAVSSLRHRKSIGIARDGRVLTARKLRLTPKKAAV